MPRRMVNSLRNMPKGGEPVTARNGQRNRVPENGRAVSAPRTSLRRLLAKARWMLPALRNRQPLARALLTRCSMAPKVASPPIPTPTASSAHVLDAGVGEHALEIGLAHHEQRRQQQRKEAQAEQGLAGQWQGRRRRPSSACRAARRERPRWSGRRPAGRRPVPAPRRRHRASRHAAAPAPSWCRSRPAERRSRHAARAGRAAAPPASRSSSCRLTGAAAAQGGIGDEQDAEHGQGDPHRADQQVFPGRLDGEAVAVVVDQRRAGQGGRFERQPEQAEVAGRWPPGSCAARKTSRQGTMTRLPRSRRISR